MDIWAQQVRQNTIKVYFLMAVLTSLLTLVGVLLSHLFNWGLTGTSSFILLSIIINIAGYFFSDRLVLRASHAKLLDQKQAPELFEIVRNLCIKENLPSPRIYLLDDQVMNAFATGRDYTHASVAVSRGLLEKMTKEEVEGVVAHELGHIKNYDMRLMTVVAVLAGFIALISDMFWYSQISSTAQNRDSSGVVAMIGMAFAIFAPLAAFFIKLAISRRREFSADATAAMITQNPKSLASALRKISFDTRLPAHISSATAHLYFSSPAHGETLIDRLFSTHPPIEERISRLENIS